MSRTPLAHDRDQLLFAESVGSMLTRIGAAVCEHDDQPPVWSEIAPSWAALCHALDVVALPLPEDVGGAAGRWSDVGVVLERTGHGLVALPYLSTMTAVRLLSRFLDSPGVSAFVRAAIGGESPPIAALPATACAGSYRPTLSTDGTTLSGVVPDVLDATLAGHFVCPAHTAGGEHALALVAARDASCQPGRLIDLTRGLADVTFDGAPAQLVAHGPQVAAATADALAFAASAVAIEAVGGTARCVDLTVGYAGVRRQFGMPVGAQQAVKHTLADVVRVLEPARAAAYAAFAALDGDGDGGVHVEDSVAVVEAAALAKITGVAAYLAAAGAAIQLHGAIGFTWDHEPHRHLKRAVCSGTLFGSDRDHRLVIMRRLLREFGDDGGAS